MYRSFTNLWTTFGAILGLILRSKSAQKGDQKWDQFWNPLPPANRTPGVAKTENKREGWKRKSCCNYTLQKKVRNRALEGAIRPSRAL